MNMAFKYRFVGGLSLLSAVGMVLSIYRMIPYGLSGETGKAKAWFILMIASIIVGLPAAIALYYFRSKMRTGGNLDRLRVEVSTLAQLSQLPVPTNKSKGVSRRPSAAAKKTGQ